MTSAQLNHPFRRLRFFSLAGTFLIAAAMAGCGGGSSGPETVSKAALIKAGDAICREADKAKGKGYVAYIKEHPRAIDSHAGQKELLIAVSVPALHGELEGLQSFEPESGAVHYKGIISALEAGISKTEAEPLSITRNASNPLKEANQLAKEYGFQSCSSFQ